MAETQNKTKRSDSVSDRYRNLGIRHVQMVAMTLCMIAHFISRSSMGVAVLAMTNTHSPNGIKTYPWDKKIQSLILSSFFWGYMTMQIPAGMLAKRYGGKPIILVALLTNGVICLVLPFLVDIGGWPMVCAARVCMGLTQACLFPASHTLLGRWLPSHERSTYTGLVYGGAQLGTIIAMPVSGVLADTAIGWTLIFYTISGLMFFTAIVWYFFSASTPGEHRLMTSDEKHYIEKGLNVSDNGMPLRTPWREILTTKALWAIVVAHFGNVLGFILFFVDMPTYLERALRISLRDSASLSALPYIGMWFGAVISGYLCERIYNRGWLSVTACRKLFNSFAAFGIGIGLIILSYLGPAHKTLAVVTLVVSLTLNGFSTAGFMSNHLDLSPNFGGVMLSLTNFIANTGSILTPIGTSFILQNDPTDISRWRIVFLITAALSFVTNIVYVIFGCSERQEWDDPDYLDKKRADPEELKPVLKADKKKENVSKKEEAQRK